MAGIAGTVRVLQPRRRKDTDLSLRLADLQKQVVVPPAQLSPPGHPLGDLGFDSIEINVRIDAALGEDVFEVDRLLLQRLNLLMGESDVSPHAVHPNLHGLQVLLGVTGGVVKDSHTDELLKQALPFRIGRPREESRVGA